MKIAQKLILFFLLTALIPLFVSEIFAYYNTQHSLDKQIQTQIANTTKRQAQKVKDMVETDLLAVRSFPTSTSLLVAMYDYLAAPTDTGLKKVTDSLNETRRYDTGYRRIHALDPDGRVIGSTDPSFLGKSYKDAEVFRFRGQKYNVAVFFKDADGNLSQYLFRQLEWRGKLVGYALLEKPVDDYISVTTDYTDLSKTGETLIVRELKGGAFQYLTPGRFDKNLALTPYQSNEERSGSNYRGADYRDHEVLLAKQDIQGIPWKVIVKMDFDEIYQPVMQLRNLAILIIVVTSIVIIVLVLYFSRRITRPLRKFTDVVKLIQAGDLSLQVPIQSHDEIGTLASSFNTMTARLKELYEGLEQKVTERTQQLNQKVQELAVGKAKDDAILESIGDGLIVTDNLGRILLINPIAADLLGIDEKTALGYQVEAIPFYDDSDTLITVENRPVEVALKTGKKITQDVKSLKKDGGKRALGVTATPVIQQGRIIGAIQTIRDITREKEVDRMKTEFISLASHQLRTPLSAIKWFTEMLVTGDAGQLNKEQAEFAQNVAESTERMIELVNSLLNISRIESGRIIVDPRPTDLSKLVTGIVNDLKGKTEEKKQTLIVSVHKELPLINLDPQLIGQVYLNLLTNAIKYTPEGGEIQVYVSRKGNELFSQVTDDGYGIPASQQQRVFQKFFRADNIVKVIADGTGLGLYLIKAIVESSGGRIWFESKEGQGTTFYFTLPMTGMVAKKGEVTLGS